MEENGPNITGRKWSLITSAAYEVMERRETNTPINLTKGHTIFMLNEASIYIWIISSLQPFLLYLSFMSTIFTIVSYFEYSYVIFYSLSCPTSTSSWHSSFSLFLLLLQIAEHSFHRFTLPSIIILYLASKLFSVTTHPSSYPNT